MPELYDSYLRKSRADRDAEANGGGDTLLRHRTALLELARKMNLTIYHIFEEVVSGETIANRPEMQKLLSEVETGQIAAVRIGEEATLKHFYKSGDMVQLIAENSAVCPPMIFSGTQLADIKIEGLAVGFCRGLL